MDEQTKADRITDLTACYKAVEAAQAEYDRKKEAWGVAKKSLESAQDALFLAVKGVVDPEPEPDTVLPFDATEREADQATMEAAAHVPVDAGAASADTAF